LQNIVKLRTEASFKRKKSRYFLHFEVETADSISMENKIHQPVKAFLVLLLLVCQLTSMAQPQRRGNIWYFGLNKGLDFSCGRPVQLSNIHVNSIEGVTTFCDEQGNVLFYSNGGGTAGFMFNGFENGRIWNRNQEVMLDLGITSGGGFSASQGVMALPSPSNPKQYYLFTVDQYSSVITSPNRDLSYFVIDMSLDGGLGEVISADVPVFEPSVECLAAARHSNGRDYWILTVDVGSSDNNDLIAVPVTNQGVMPPIRHARQLKHFPIIIKTSPDSRFLFDGNVLYDFDATTSAITPKALLPVAYNYSFCFSPESRYLYTFNNDIPKYLVRYDMQATDIPNSIDTIANLDNAFARQIQIGPDGNLYFPERILPDTRVDVSIVHCPDSPEPEVERRAFNFPAVTNYESFNAMNNLADFWYDDIISFVELDTTEQLLCSNAPLTLEPECIGQTYEWSTGETTRSIVVDTPGEYRVQVKNGCFTGMETILVNLATAPSVHIAHAPVMEFCDALPLTMTAVSDQASDFRWSTGDTLASISILHGGDFQVTVSNVCGEAVAEVTWPEAPCCRTYAPNAFSPNLDGINDQFKIAPYRCPITDFRLRLFSRWGELVFETTDPEQGWDGRFNNQFLPQGLYIWLATYQLATDPPDRFQQERGGVHLVR